MYLVDSEPRNEGFLEWAQPVMGPDESLVEQLSVRRNLRVHGLQLEHDHRASVTAKTRDWPPPGINPGPLRLGLKSHPDGSRAPVALLSPNHQKPNFPPKTPSSTSLLIIPLLNLYSFCFKATNQTQKHSLISLQKSYYFFVDFLSLDSLVEEQTN